MNHKNKIDDKQLQTRRGASSTERGAVTVVCLERRAYATKKNLIKKMAEIT